jgi:hypothetical protein
MGAHTDRLDHAGQFGKTVFAEGLLIIAADEILIALLADDEDLPEDEDPLSRLNLAPEDIPY